MDIDPRLHKYDFANLGFLEDEDIVLDLAALEIFSLDHPNHSFGTLIDLLAGTAAGLGRIGFRQSQTARERQFTACCSRSATDYRRRSMMTSPWRGRRPSITIRCDVARRGLAMVFMSSSLNRYFFDCLPYGVVAKVRSHGLLQMTIAALVRGAGYRRPEWPSSAGYDGSVRRYGGEHRHTLASRVEH